MELTKAITLLLFVAATTASNITYNVVSFVPNNQTLGVIVDNNLYPLAATYTSTPLLHIGDAPAATKGYKYAILNSSSLSIIEQENFTRSPVTEGKTLNEYYNRSWNSMNLTQLPIIMDPIPAIHRIETGLHVDGEIPTIHITGNQTAIDLMHQSNFADFDVNELKMTYISPRDVKTFENVTLALSGFSSRNFAKLSYKLNIPKESGDLYKYRRFKLRAMAVDMSYMREEIAYAVCNSVGLPCPGFSYARLFINEQPLGLFGFADNMKNPWPRNVFADGKKYNQGAVFIASAEKASNAVAFEGDANNKDDLAQGHLRNTTGTSTADLSYLGDNITRYALNYNVREKPSEGTANYTRIMDLTQFISGQPNTTSDNSAIARWNEKMDVTSFLRGLAMEVVLSNGDGYLANANNYVLFDDLQTERLIFSSQDLDGTMGTSSYDPSLIHGGNYSNFPGLLTRPLTSRLLVVPQFKEEFDNLVHNITTQLVNTNVLFPRIDDLYEFLKQDVAWDKSCTRVGKVDIASSIGNFSMDQIPFMFGINGTFPDPALANYSISIKNWIQLRSTNLIEYFSNTSKSSTN